MGPSRLQMVLNPGKIPRRSSRLQTDTTFDTSHMRTGVSVEVHDASRCTMPQGARCSSRYATTMRIQYNNNTTTRIPGWRRRRQKQGYDDDNDEDMWCWQWWGYAVRNHLTLIAIVKNNLMSMRLKSLSMYKGVSTRSNNYQSTRWLWVNHPVQARKAITQSKHVAHCSLLDGGCVVIVACLYPSSRPDWECRWQQQRVENREFAEVSSWSVVVSDAVMMYFRNGRSNIAIEIVDEDLLEKAFTESLVMEEETRKGDLSNEEDVRELFEKSVHIHWFTYITIILNLSLDSIMNLCVSQKVVMFVLYLGQAQTTCWSGICWSGIDHATGLKTISFLAR